MHIHMMLYEIMWIQETRTICQKERVLYDECMLPSQFVSHQTTLGASKKCTRHHTRTIWQIPSSSGKGAGCDHGQISSSSSDKGKRGGGGDHGHKHAFLVLGMGSVGGDHGQISCSSSNKKVWWWRPWPYTTFRFSEREGLLVTSIHTPSSYGIGTGMVMTTILGKGKGWW